MLNNPGKHSRRVVLLLVATLWSVISIIWPVKSAEADTGGYPYANDPTCADDQCTPDPWKFFKRECTSFVAWKLNVDNNFVFKNDYNGDGALDFGDATRWKVAAERFKIPVDDNPVAGSVAWWSFGHVAWVEAVIGNEVVIQEYNYDRRGNYNRRTVSKSTVDGYIHFKDLEETSSPSSNNTVLRVLHRTEPDGSNVVYWAKEGSVFETWWRPGQSVPKHTELIRIAQNNIVDIDMHVKPGNVHLLYTATKTGIWETWWTPGGSLHHGLIIPNATYAGNVRKIQKAMQTDGTEQLYVMTDAGVDEYWWRAGTGINRGRIFTLRDPVAMKKYTAPNGKQHVYVADRAYAYEVSWGTGATDIGIRQIIHISQADISDLDLSVDGDGKRRLYVSQAGNSVWEASWVPSSGTISYWRVTGDTGVQAIQKYMDGYNHVLYVATQGGVYEYWWPPGATSVDGDPIVSGLSGVQDFHRSNSVDGARAVYSAFSTHVAESWWFAGGNIRTNLIA